MRRFNAFALAAIALLNGCRPPVAQKVAPISEPYLSDPNSVGFDVSPLAGTEGTRRWLATYVDQGKTARFTIEIASPKPMEGEKGVNLEMSSGTGALVSDSGSDASALLAALRKALEAKHALRRVKRVQRLPFEYVILGEHDSQAHGGGFSPNPPGNWTAMKIFLGEGDDESEVFLNFNPVSRKAQFSEKDVDYGDPVLAKLASVL
jgi:hypothetical protein